MFTKHQCEWCDREEPTVCVETPHYDGLILHMQSSYLCLWCMTEEYNRRFVIDQEPKR